ncbi:MAG: hypothetical protein ACRDL7_07660 [Gaiellaceae bacterium]
MSARLERTARLLGCLGVSFSLVLALGAGHSAGAQDEQGCCQFLSRSTDASPSRGQRRCDDLTRRECSLLKPGSVFLCHWACDSQSQRCLLGVLPSTYTPTPTPTKTPTPSPTEPRGCCQVDNVRTVHHAICGNEVSMTSCLNETKGEPSFCADCECSSHSGPGYSFDVGVCVTRTPTPTVTATPEERSGCCQLTGLSGARGAVCGNVRESTCLHGFDADAVFCADCVCSSHSSPGVDLVPGLCMPPTPTRGPRTRPTARPPRLPHH